MAFKDTITHAFVLDIETLAPIELLADPAQERVLAEAAAKRELTVEAYCALTPGLAQIYCATIGRIRTADLVLDRAVCYFDASLGELDTDPQPAVTAQHRGLLVTCTALPDAVAVVRDILRVFLTTPRRIVTWNGRGFDLPVLLHAAARHGLNELTGPIRAAMSETRWTLERNYDLMDAMAFFGATSRLSLAAAAIGYGLPNPKAGAVDGASLATAIDEGRIADVLTYNIADVATTAALYVKWLGTPPPQTGAAQPPDGGFL